MAESVKIRLRNTAKLYEQKLAEQEEIIRRITKKREV